MANSKFTITFLQIPEVNDEIHIGEDTLGLDLRETFKNLRLGLYQTTIPNGYDIGEVEPEIIYSGYLSQNYKTAFNLDHNSTGLFTVTATNGDVNQGLGSVVIEATYPGAVFVDNNTLPEVIEVTIENEAAPTPITIDSVTYSEADADPCQNVKVTVETSVLATKVTSTTQIAPITEASKNMLLYSEDLTNSVWSKDLVNISGKKVIATNTYGYHLVSQTVEKGTSSGNFTFSMFVKAAESNIIEMFVRQVVGSAQVNVAFNLSTESLIYGFGFSGFTLVSSNIEDVGEGYFRVSVTCGLNTDNEVIVQAQLRSPGGESDYTGDNTSGLFLDKFQFHEGDLLPYIQTTSTAVDVSASDGLSIDPNTENPFEFTVLRSAFGILTVENSEGSQFTDTFQAPSPLNSANFAIGVNNSPNGATITVSNQFTFGLDLEYSLDGSTWQSSNIFSGLVADTYTMYVRDQLGCSFDIDFVVNDANIYVPHFYYSKSNGLRLAQTIVWGSAANYKTDENTLSCDVDVEVPHHEIQFKQTADVETYQFQSNYALNEVKVINPDLSEDTIPVIKKSDYVGVKDKRDARKYNLGNGKVGIYFMAGDTYDYNTDAVNGSHALNGLLPEWGVVGNYINIAGSWFLIEQTLFDESKNAEILVITETYSGGEISVIAGCIYNVYDFEIYEFTIDYLPYMDERIRVKLTSSDPNFTTIEHLSESIEVKVRHEFTLDINYWNNDNNDVNYSTGIRHRIRMLYTRIDNGDEEESSIHKTDTNAILLSADLYEGEKFIFEPTTKEMWRKLKMALSHKNVFIDGVKYVKNGEFESDGPLEESNLYVLKATMLKAGNVYNSDGSTFGAGNASNANIPGIIQGNDSFIKY